MNFRATRRVLPNMFVETLFVPTGEHFRLTFSQISAHWEISFGQIQRLFVVGHLIYFVMGTKEGVGKRGITRCRLRKCMSSGANHLPGIVGIFRNLSFKFVQ